MVTFRDVEGSAPRPAAPRHIAVTKTEEQLREEILADLRDLGLLGDAGQLKAAE
jgi:hypothetical protein